MFEDDKLSYNILTNLYESAPFELNNLTFKTVEHYYNWKKFSDPIMQKRILNAPTGLMAREISKKYNYLIISDFDEIKDIVMLDALRAKFSQHPLLVAELMQTKSDPIVYHNMYDTYWADGGDGSGHNKLGKLLEQIRSELERGILSTKTPVVNV